METFEFEYEVEEELFPYIYPLIYDLSGTIILYQDFYDVGVYKSRGLPIKIKMVTFVNQYQIYVTILSNTEYSTTEIREKDDPTLLCGASIKDNPTLLCVSGASIRDNPTLLRVDGTSVRDNLTNCLKKIDEYYAAYYRNKIPDTMKYPICQLLGDVLIHDRYYNMNWRDCDLVHYGTSGNFIILIKNKLVYDSKNYHGLHEKDNESKVRHKIINLMLAIVNGTAPDELYIESPITRTKSART